MFDVRYSLHPSLSYPELRVIGPSTENNSLSPAVLLCPGGGYISTQENEIEFIVLQFLARGYTCFVLYHGVEAPFAQMPQPIESFYAALKYIEQIAPNYGLDIRRLRLMGWSTGAHLITQSFCNLQSELHTSFKELKIHSICLLYPILDLKALIPFSGMEMTFSALAGRRTPTDSFWSKYSYCRPSSALPPVCIVEYQNDPFLPTDTLTDYLIGLKENDINYLLISIPNKRHGDPRFSILHSDELSLRKSTELGSVIVHSNYLDQYLLWDCQIY